MKLISVIMALLMAVIMVACSSSSQPEAPMSNIETQIEESQESYTRISPQIKENPYSNIKNYFQYTVADLGITLDKENPDFYTTTWTNVDEASLRYSIYCKSDIGIGIISNEDYSQNAVLWLDIFNVQEDKFAAMIHTLDWHPEDNPDDERPYGYIATGDSIILVNATNVYESYRTDTYYYELYNINAIADVMGINIQDYLQNITCVEDAFEIASNLNLALYLGTRGYDDYLSINPFGIICEDYETILISLNNPYDGMYADIYSCLDSSDEEPADDSQMEDKSVYDYALDPDSGYDFNHEPENWSDLIQGFNALNENLIEHFWDIADATVN